MKWGEQGAIAESGGFTTCINVGYVLESALLKGIGNCLYNYIIYRLSLFQAKI